MPPPARPAVRPISAVGLDLTAGLRFRFNKINGAGRTVNPSSFLLSLSHAQPQQPKSTRRRRHGGEGWRRREPPRRRACSPSVEHAAVERLHGRCQVPARSSTKPAATEGSPTGFLTAGGGYCSGEVVLPLPFRSKFDCYH
jgi:hypothetical protein